MRILLIVILLCGFISSPVFAEKIILNNGQIIEAKILEENDRQIKVEVDGIPLTYYLDEVQIIRNKKDKPKRPLPEKPSALSTFDKAQDKQYEKVNQDLLLKAQRDLRFAAMDKRQLVLRYMEVTGVKGEMRKAFAEIVQNAPQGKKRNLKKVLKVEDVLEELSPIYEQYFTEKDLKELIMFYESALGQKILKTSPLIIKESAEKSLEYFKDKIE